MSDLEHRRGLPDALRVLYETLPRTDWEAHPHFDGLTRFWMERHMMFRELMSRLESGTRARLDGGIDPQRHAREVQAYAGMLLNQLHGHHQIEDVHYFPHLQKLDKRLEKGFEILDRDHEALDGHMAALAESANAYLKAWDRPEATDRAGELEKALGRFGGFLDRHLTDEEDIVVPVILTYGAGLE